MARRKFVTATTRQVLFGIPTDTASFEKYYVFGSDDLEFIAARRRQANQLGLALHLALLRHPGQGWRERENRPDQLMTWISDQLTWCCHGNLRGVVRGSV